jgi:putative transposase
MTYPMQPGAPLAITQRPESDPAGPSPALPLAGADRPAEGPDRTLAAATARSLLDDQLLDEMVARMRADGARLTGPGGVLTEMIKAVLERGLAAELTSHLGYDKHDPAGVNSGNSRNGSTPKTVLTEVGPVPLDVPRDRAGTFTPTLVPKGERRLGGLSDVIISLYAGGMTVRDICHHLHRVYGTDLSPDTVSTVTDSVLEEVKTWQTRPLDECYPVIFVDALMVKVRDGNAVRNKAAHLVVGVDTDGIKHVLGIWLQNTEGAKFWMQVFSELRNRGVRRVLIACCDGLEGLPEAIETIWPYTIVQTCVVHLIRASLKYANYNDRKRFAQALRPVYTAVNADAAEHVLLELAESELGRKYKAAIAVWERAWERFIPFLEFPPNLRRVIYTTNTIESLNFQLRKIIKNRGHFPTDDSVVKLLWLAICDIEDKRARARDAERGKPPNERTAPARLIEGSITTGWRDALAALDEFCQTRNLQPIH